MTGEHLLFLLGARVGDRQLEQEAVTLCFRELVDAFALDGVLCGKHEKGIGQRMALATDRHLMLLHRFKQGTLHLCRSAVYFIGKDKVGEYWSFFY